MINLSMGLKVVPAGLWLLFKNNHLILLKVLTKEKDCMKNRELEIRALCLGLRVMKHQN